MNMENFFCKRMLGADRSRTQGAMCKFSVALCMLFLTGNVAWAGNSLSTEAKAGEADTVLNTQEISQKKNTVTGKVTDAAGEPVIGASVMEKGTSNGTVTDLDGNFSLAVADGKTLVISYIGMQSQEIVVKGKKNFQVVLKDDAVAINEVVVVGYGTQKKINLTGSIATVKSDKLVQAHRPKLSSALAGNLPGIRAVQKSGRPGEDGAEIDIRGFGEALVIVDGVESSYNAIDPMM